MADNAQKSLSDSSRGVSERTNSLQSTAATSIGSENNDEYLEKDDRFDADMQEFAKSVETWRQTVKESQVAESESANELNQEILETDDSPKTFEEEVDKAKTLLCSLIDSTKEQGKRFGPDSLQHAAFWDDELARFCVWWGEARQHLPQIESELRASTSGGTVDALIQDLHALSDDLAEGLAFLCSGDGTLDLTIESRQTENATRLLMKELYDAVHASISGLFRRNKLYKAERERNERERASMKIRSKSPARIRGQHRVAVSSVQRTRINAPPDHQREQIAPIEREFKRMRQRYFVVGRVFHMMHVEEGRNATGKESSVWSRNTYGQWIHTKPRRFVVVRADARTCLAVPITSYTGLGVSKPFVKKSDHCIAYTGQEPPSPLDAELPGPGEEGMQPKSIRIEVDDATFRLDPTSRIDFAKPRTVSHDTLIKRFGCVHPGSIKALVDQFRAVLDPKRPNRGKLVQVDDAPAGLTWPSVLENADDQDRLAYQALVKGGFRPQRASEYVWGYVQARERTRAGGRSSVR